jgi:hypothetical protein
VRGTMNETLPPETFVLISLQSPTSIYICEVSRAPAGG